MTHPAEACKTKRVWYSRALAQTVADLESSSKPLLGTDRLYVYECPVASCGGYHLTKIPQGGDA